MRHPAAIRVASFLIGRALDPLAQTRQWAQTYLVSVPKKPQDSVRLYQHPIRVDHSGVRKLQEVIATVKALEQQRSSGSDD